MNWGTQPILGSQKRAKRTNLAGIFSRFSLVPKITPIYGQAGFE